MELAFTPYVLPYVIAGLVSLALFVRLWTYRERRGARGFLLDVAGIVLISAFYTVELLSTDPTVKEFWWNLRYVPMTFMAVGYMLMAIEYTDNQRLLTRRRVAGIVVSAVLVQVAVWTNPLHGLTFAFEYDAAANLLVPQFGPFYWVLAAILTSFIVIGVSLLLDLAGTQRAYRKQAAILVGTITLVMAGEVVWWLGWVPIDPIPLTSTVKVVGFLYGVAHFELLDIVPVAREAVIENMRDPVFVVDRTGHVVDVNDAGRRLVGSENPIREHVDTVFADDRIGVDCSESEEVTFTVDGETRYFDFQSSPLQDERGRSSGELFVFRDITQQKQREEELSILNRIVRHDINNDMAVIRGRSELLKPHVDEAGRDHLESIQQSGAHVVELTENVRDLMASLTDDRSIEVEPIDLCLVLETQLRQARQQHENAQFVLERDLPENCRVRATEMLSSVFTNLFNNAVQHNDTDHPRVTVTVETDESTVTVEVGDNGPGIPETERDEIFGRGEKGLDSDGTGIGLYLVGTLVDRYGGDITVGESDAGGAAFRIELPRSEVPAETPTARSTDDD